MFRIFSNTIVVIFFLYQNLVMAQSCPNNSANALSQQQESFIGNMANITSQLSQCPTGFFNDLEWRKDRDSVSCNRMSSHFDQDHRGVLRNLITRSRTQMGKIQGSELIEAITQCEEQLPNIPASYYVDWWHQRMRFFAGEVKNLKELAYLSIVMEDSTPIEMACEDSTFAGISSEICNQMRKCVKQGESARRQMFRKAAQDNLDVINAYFTHKKEIERLRKNNGDAKKIKDYEAAVQVFELIIPELGRKATNQNYYNMAKYLHEDKSMDQERKLNMLADIEASQAKINLIDDGLYKKKVAKLQEDYQKMRSYSSCLSGAGNGKGGRYRNGVGDVAVLNAKHGYANTNKFIGLATGAKYDSPIECSDIDNVLESVGAPPVTEGSIDGSSPLDQYVSGQLRNASSCSESRARSNDIHDAKRAITEAVATLPLSFLAGAKLATGAKGLSSAVKISKAGIAIDKAKLLPMLPSAMMAAWDGGGMALGVKDAFEGCHEALNQRVNNNANGFKIDSSCPADSVGDQIGTIASDWKSCAVQAFMAVGPDMLISGTMSLPFFRNSLERLVKRHPKLAMPLTDLIKASKNSNINLSHVDVNVHPDVIVAERADSHVSSQVDVNAEAMPKAPILKSGNVQKVVGNLDGSQNIVHQKVEHNGVSYQVKNHGDFKSIEVDGQVKKVEWENGQLKISDVKPGEIPKLESVEIEGWGKNAPKAELSYQFGKPVKIKFPGSSDWHKVVHSSEHGFYVVKQNTGIGPDGKLVPGSKEYFNLDLENGSVKRIGNTLSSNKQKSSSTSSAKIEAPAPVEHNWGGTAIADDKATTVKNYKELIDNGIMESNPDPKNPYTPEEIKFMYDRYKAGELSSSGKALSPVEVKQQFKLGSKQSEAIQPSATNPNSNQKISNVPTSQASAQLPLEIKPSSVSRTVKDGDSVLHNGTYYKKRNLGGLDYLVDKEGKIFMRYEPDTNVPVRQVKSSHDLNVGQKLGQGGLGAVYNSPKKTGVDVNTFTLNANKLDWAPNKSITNLPEDYVIKVAESNDNGSQGSKAKHNDTKIEEEILANEVNILKKLNKAGVPNVPEVFFSGEYVDKPKNLKPSDVSIIPDQGFKKKNSFMAMTKYEGSDLSKDIDIRNMDEFLNISASITDTVAKANDQGILHLDIKPENIMITADGPKLIDFGISREMNEKGMYYYKDNEPFTGTAGYVFFRYDGANKVYRSYEADVYASGAVIYHKLFGQTPTDARINYGVGQPYRKPPTYAELQAGVYPHFLQDMDQKSYERLTNLLETILVPTSNKALPTGYQISAELRAIQAQLRQAKQQQHSAKTPVAIPQAHKPQKILDQTEDLRPKPNAVNQDELSTEDLNF